MREGRPLYCLSPIIAEKTLQTSSALRAVKSSKQRSDLTASMELRVRSREALQRERGLNSRHVLIKKGLRVLTVSPPASLVSTQRPPSLLFCQPPPPSPHHHHHPPPRAQNVSIQIRTGDQGMRVWEEWVVVGLVGWLESRRGKGGVYVGWGCCPI